MNKETKFYLYAFTIDDSNHTKQAKFTKANLKFLVFRVLILNINYSQNNKKINDNWFLYRNKSAITRRIFERKTKRQLQLCTGTRVSNSTSTLCLFGGDAKQSQKRRKFIFANLRWNNTDDGLGWA